MMTNRIFNLVLILGVTIAIPVDDWLTYTVTVGDDVTMDCNPVIKDFNFESPCDMILLAAREVGIAGYCKEDGAEVETATYYRVTNNIDNPSSPVHEIRGDLVRRSHLTEDGVLSIFRVRQTDEARYACAIYANQSYLGGYSRLIVKSRDVTIPTVPVCPEVNNTDSHQSATCMCDGNDTAAIVGWTLGAVIVLSVIVVLILFKLHICRCNIYKIKELTTNPAYGAEPPGFGGPHVQELPPDHPLPVPLPARNNQRPEVGKIQIINTPRGRNIEYEPLPYTTIPVDQDGLIQPEEGENQYSHIPTNID